MANALDTLNTTGSPSTSGVAAPWHARAADEIVRELGSDAHRGLSVAEAAARLARDGPNVITAKKGRAWWVRLLLQFHAPLVYILIVAGGVTLFLAEYVDSAVILGVVLANALIGFVQESKAVKAIDALSRSMRVEATVKRDGTRRRVDAAELVVGDVVHVEPGDKVPADLRLVVVKDLRVELQGHSHTVIRDSAGQLVESAIDRPGAVPTALFSSKDEASIARQVRWRLLRAGLRAGWRR